MKNEERAARDTAKRAADEAYWAKKRADDEAYWAKKKADEAEAARRKAERR